jgi:hypothetical protein
MKRALKSLVLIVAVTVVLGFSVSSIRGPTPLLSISRAVTSVATLGAQTRNGFQCPWFWLGNDRIFVVRQNETTLLGNASGSKGMRRAVVIEVGTGRETELPDFDEKIRRLETSYGNNLLRIIGPSPTGDMLLWRSSPRTLQEDVFATRIDGTLVGKWGAAASTIPRIHHWNQDGSGWVKFFMGSGATGLKRVQFVDLARPEMTREVKLSTNLVRGPTMGFDSTGRYLVCESNFNGQESQVEFVSLDLSKPDARPASFSTAGPPGRAIAFIAYSRTTDRLAWIVSARKDPQLGSPVGNMLRGSPPYMELWVSKLDGSKMRLVGVVDASPSSPSRLQDWCRWSPDGRQVAFTHRQTVHVVRVD